MTYSITNSVNGTITILDGSVDNTTSLTLNGRGSTGWGQYNTQNLYSMLCNYAGTLTPNNPIIGQLWYDSNTQLLNYLIATNTWDQIASQQWVNGNFATLAELNALAAKEGSDVANLQSELNALSTKESGDVANLQSEISALSANSSSDIAALENTLGSYVTKADLYSPPAGSSPVAIGAGGTGLTTIGTANQVLQVNASSNGLQYVTLSTEAVTSFNGRVGAVTLTASDVDSALGYTPLSSTGAGASGSWNINAATATTATSVGHALSPSSYISGSAYNGSAAQTWSINATPNDSANTIVARDENGDIWISDLNTSANINCSGAIVASGDITALASDERLKHDIHTIENALALTKQLRGVRYKRKDIENHRGNIGFIAQEIQKVIPEVVHEGNDGYLSVLYQNVVGLLVESIKELSDEVESLKPLKDEVSSLRNELLTMQQIVNKVITYQKNDINE